MKSLLRVCVIGIIPLLLPIAVQAQQQRDAANSAAAPQGNVPPAVQRVEERVEETARRYRVGVQGGVGLDPELVDVGVHAMIGPLFRPAIAFRPGVELGLGEVTTVLAVNLDVLYTFSGVTRDTRWAPYVGAGPTFGLSHRGFATDDGENVDVTGVDDSVTERSRFDFSDTDFNGGVNFIAGMRRQNGMFFELKATAWGVSNIRLLVGINF